MWIGVKRVKGEWLGNKIGNRVTLSRRPSLTGLSLEFRLTQCRRFLGTNLTGATRVMFNRKAADFTVVSNSEIITSVPAGASTGKVR